MIVRTKFNPQPFGKFFLSFQEAGASEPITAVRTLPNLLAQGYVKLYEPEDGGTFRVLSDARFPDGDTMIVSGIHHEPQAAAMLIRRYVDETTKFDPDKYICGSEIPTEADAARILAQFCFDRAPF